MLNFVLRGINTQLYLSYLPDVNTDQRHCVSEYRFKPYDRSSVVRFESKEDAIAAVESYHQRDKSIHDVEIVEVFSAI